MQAIADERQRVWWFSIILQYFSPMDNPLSISSSECVFISPQWFSVPGDATLARDELKHDGYHSRGDGPGHPAAATDQRHGPKMKRKDGCSTSFCGLKMCVRRHENLVVLWNVRQYDKSRDDVVQHREVPATRCVGGGGNLGRVPQISRSTTLTHSYPCSYTSPRHEALTGPDGNG